jgi:hypothetical protein
VHAARAAGVVSIPDHGHLSSGGPNLARRSDACRYAAHLRGRLGTPAPPRQWQSRLLHGTPTATQIASIGSSDCPIRSPPTICTTNMSCLRCPDHPITAPPTVCCQNLSRLRFASRCECPGFHPYLRSGWLSPHAGERPNSSKADAARNVRCGREAATSRMRLPDPPAKRYAPLPRSTSTALRC